MRMGRTALALGFMLGFTLACSDGGSSGGCGDLCGCWTDVTLNYAVTVVNSSGTGAAGVTATCVGDQGPIATAGADGVLAFSIQTRESPGCSFERCRNINVTDPAGNLETIQLSAESSNGATVQLCPTGQQGGGPVQPDAGVNCRP